MAGCDSCVYNVYDEDDEEYYCEVDMDEDDAARLMQGHYKECPYYQLDDEYAVVRHSYPLLSHPDEILRMLQRLIYLYMENARIHAYLSRAHIILSALECRTDPVQDLLHV